MNKSLKILVISLICSFLFFVTNCFAVNIEMNLVSNDLDSSSSNTSDDSTVTAYNNLLDDSSNIVANSGVDNEINGSTQGSNTATASSNVVSEASSSSTNRNVGIADTLQALPESELGLTNILNILLITVGVVLILLSVAIFIKLKK